MAKRAPNGKGSIMRRTISKNGKSYQYYYGRITVGYDPGTGKQIQKTFTAKTQREVKRKMTEHQMLMNSAEQPATEQITLSAFLLKWLRMKKDNISWNTYSTYEQQIIKRVIPWFGEKLLLPDLTAFQVQSFINDLKQKGLSAKTIKCAHGVLSSALSDAVRFDFIEKNPAEKTELPKAAHREVKPWTDQELKDFISISTSYRYGDILLFIILTGLREAECLGLCYDCIDFKKNRIMIRRQLQKHGNDLVIIDGTKTERSTRSLVLPPVAMQILTARRDKQDADKHRAGDAWRGWQNEKERRGYFIFTTDLGLPVSNTNLYLTAKRMGKKLGKPDLTVHDLRHVYASLCLENGTDLKTVSESLGHSSIAVTADIYTSVSDKLKEENALRMESLISKLSR